MIKTWIFMIIGSIAIFEGVAVFISGINYRNFWVILFGTCLAFPSWYYLVRYGWHKRQEILTKKQIKGG